MGERVKHLIKLLKITDKVQEGFKKAGRNVFFLTIVSESHSGRGERAILAEPLAAHSLRHLTHAYEVEHQCPRLLFYTSEIEVVMSR